MCRRSCVRISDIARVAVAVRVGHAAGQGGGGLAAGAGSSVAPASVSALVLGHLRLHADGRQRRVLVRVVAILFHLFPARFLCILPRLALPPKPDTSEQEQSDNDNRDDNGDGGLSTGIQSTGGLLAVRLCESWIGWIGGSC